MPDRITRNRKQARASHPSVNERDLLSQQAEEEVEKPEHRRLPIPAVFMEHTQRHNPTSAANYSG
jgi:hypothetical protein